MSVPHEIKNLQASVIALNTVTKGRSLIITDSPQSWLKQFPISSLGKIVHKAPDKGTMVSGFNGDVHADAGIASLFGLFWL